MNKEEINKAIKVVFNEECKECYFPKRRRWIGYNKLDKKDKDMLK